LAKTFHDEYIHKLVVENPELEKYDLRNNKGYVTKKHREVIELYGPTKWHRMSFGKLQNY
jgi:ribonuclease HII